MTSLLRPLVLATLAFLAGLLPALRFAPSPLLLLGIALAALALASGGVRRRVSSTAALPPELPLYVAFLGIGSALGALAVRQTERDCRSLLPDGAAMEVEGVLGASLVAAAGADARIPLLPLEHARAVGEGPRCAGVFRVRLPPSGVELRAGTRLRLAGEWVRQSPSAVPSPWPDDPLFRGFIAADTLLSSTPPSPAAHPLLFLRGRAEKQLERLFPRHSALADALLLGRRERMDPALRERFARSGLVHLLAISGTHVGLLAGILVLVGGVLRMPRRRVAWGTILLIALYLAVIGAPASALRSGIMVSLGLLAVVLQRPSAALPVVAAAALVLLAWDPLGALDPGFQLSFAGVGAVLLARRVAAPRALRRGPPRALWDSLVLSTIAFLLTAPITAHHFTTVAPVSILANLPAIPLTSLALVGILSAAVVEPILPALARLQADGAGVALDALDRVASLAAQLPLGHLPVARPAWAAWLAVAVALLAAWNAAARLRTVLRWSVAAGATLSVALGWPALASGSQDALEIHFIDVGQGDAIAIRTPADRWLLIDTGPRGRDFDAGERRVLPFLRAQGARRLEALILTHPDADHIGGAAAVLRGIPVGLLIEPGLPVGKELYLETLSLVEESGVPWRAARAGRSLRLDGVELRFLWPETLVGASEANEISAVAHLRFGDFSMLLTGDVSAEVEARLVEREGDGLRARVLKAGHHGSRTSTSEALVRAVRPELVVISAGRRNRYGHPAPEVLGLLRRHGIEIARTDRESTISLQVAAPDGVPWRRIER